MARPAPVLVIEDDPRLAGRIARLLDDADLDMDGPYATVSDAAAALARHFPDVAIIDLHRENADLLIADLQSYDIPFLFCPHDASAPQPRGRSLLVGEEELASTLLPCLLGMLSNQKARERRLLH